MGEITIDRAGMAALRLRCIANSALNKKKLLWVCQFRARRRRRGMRQLWRNVLRSVRRLQARKEWDQTVCSVPALVAEEQASQRLLPGLRVAKARCSILQWLRESHLCALSLSAV
jgi:hypothetical protein